MTRSDFWKGPALVFIGGILIGIGLGGLIFYPAGIKMGVQTERTQTKLNELVDELERIKEARHDQPNAHDAGGHVQR